MYRLLSPFNIIPGTFQSKCMVAEDKSPTDVVNDVMSEDDVVASETEEISEDVEMRNMVRTQNRKKKSGGFQSMGVLLCFCIFLGFIWIYCRIWDIVGSNPWSFGHV